jgi:primosomal protein N' (replication factor Y)
MRNEDVPGGKWVSPALKTAIAARLEKGEQSLIFLNRRGFAPSLHAWCQSW